MSSPGSSTHPPLENPADRRDVLRFYPRRPTKPYADEYEMVRGMEIIPRESDIVDHSFLATATMSITGFPMRNDMSARQEIMSSRLFICGVWKQTYYRNPNAVLRFSEYIGHRTRTTTSQLNCKNILDACGLLCIAFACYRCRSDCNPPP